MTLVTAVAMGAIYFAVGGVAEFLMMRGPFVGERIHGGLEYPLRLASTAIHVDGWMIHSGYGEFIFFGGAGTLLYALAGALIGWVIDCALFRAFKTEEHEMPDGK